MELREWEEFSLSSLFEIVKGSRLTKSQMKEGATRFIGSSAFQNGLTAHVANMEKLHPANTITVCYNGSVGETFYQDQPFWASDDVNVLYPKFGMTRHHALFICPLIRAVGKRYAFVNKWKKEEMEKATIKLPTTPAGQPDWSYMETYMNRIWEESRSTLLGLRI